MVSYRIIRWVYIELSDYRVRTVGRRHGDGATCWVVTVAKKVAWARRHGGYAATDTWDWCHGGKLHWLCNDAGEVIASVGVNADGRDSRELFACSSYPELA